MNNIKVDKIIFGIFLVSVLFAFSPFNTRAALPPPYLSHMSSCTQQGGQVEKLIATEGSYSYIDRWKCVCSDNKIDFNIDNGKKLPCNEWLEPETSGGGEDTGSFETYSSGVYSETSIFSRILKWFTKWF